MPKCVICLDTVLADTPGNVLKTRDGDAECPAQYWVVRRLGTVVATFFATYNGKGPRARAMELARTDPDYKARQIKPHGHQIK